MDCECDGMASSVALALVVAHRQKTLWGNLILGPTARYQHEWPDPNVDPDSKIIMHDYPSNGPSCT